MTRSAAVIRKEPPTTAAANGKMIVLLPQSDLELDPENPRLVLSPNADQLTVLKKLYAEEDLLELAPSIARNGFFVEEPLVVIPHPKRSKRYVVVEGNRRLATVNILGDAALRKRLGATDWPEINKARCESLRRLPCVVHETREQVEAFLIYRHITGIKKWDYFQKSRYVARLIDRGSPIDDIESQIGDDVGTIKKLYQNFLVFKHIRDDLSFDTSRIAQNFSILEVALGQRPIKRFLGLPARLPTAKTERLIEDDQKLQNLRELVSWIFGDPETGEEKIITDHRDINSKLAKVIGHPTALQYLRETRDLDAAFERSWDEKEFFVRQLLAAGRSLKRALGEAPRFADDSDIAITEQVVAVRKLVNALCEILKIDADSADSNDTKPNHQ